MLKKFFGIENGWPLANNIEGDALLPFTIIALAIVSIVCIKRNVSFGKTFFLLAFVLYLFALLEVTIFPVPYEIPEFITVSPSPRLNVVPFAEMIDHFGGGGGFQLESVIKNWGGNFLLLLPMGIALPYLLHVTIKKGIQYIILISVSIELIQFIGSFLIFKTSWKSADIDDVIFNSIGGCVGLGIYRLFPYIGSALKSKGGD
jgi:glycopeptide antibiotics resistance protein